MWLNKLEEKFGRYAIPNLPKIIVLLYAVGFVIANISPRLYSLLELNPYLILHGQVWRIVTFLLIGPETNLIFVIFVLLFYYSIGSSLEQVWGTFRFNMYYLIGVLGTIVGAFLTYAILAFAYGYFLSEHDVIFSICVYVPRDGSIFVYDPSNQGKMAWILRWIIFNLHFFKFRLYSRRNFG